MKDSYYTLTIELLEVITFFKQKMKEFDLPKISFEFAGSRYTIEAPLNENINYNKLIKKTII